MFEKFLVFFDTTVIEVIECKVRDDRLISVLKSLSKCHIAWDNITTRDADYICYKCKYRKYLQFMKTLQSMGWNLCGREDSVFSTIVKN